MLITHFFTSLVVETSETNIIDFVKVSLGKSCKSASVNFVEVALGESCKSASVNFVKVSLGESCKSTAVNFVKVSLGESCKSTPVDFVEILPDSSKGGATETKTNVRLICLDDFPVFGSH